MHLQNLASIQPRTGLSTFAKISQKLEKIKTNIGTSPCSSCCMNAVMLPMDPAQSGSNRPPPGSVSCKAFFSSLQHRLNNFSNVWLILGQWQIAAHMTYIACKVMANLENSAKWFRRPQENSKCLSIEFAKICADTAENEPSFAKYWRTYS